VLLPCLTVGLVACGAVVLGLAGVSGAGGVLMRQADNDLLACTGSMLRGGMVAAPGAGPLSGPLSGRAAPGACGAELLSAGGQVLATAAPGAAAGPVIPAGGSWLTAHLARPVTVPGAGASGNWRVVAETVRYQPQRIPYVYGPDNMRYLISGRQGAGSSGTLVVMADLAADRVTGRIAAGYAAAAGTVLALLAAAALAMTQASLRPLRRTAERAGRAGRAAAAEQLRASHAAEAAARQAAAELSGHLGTTARHLLRSADVVRGAAQSWRQQPRLPAARRDRMLRQVADEAARMETLIEGLDRDHRLPFSRL
jgi:signal transduction histidine kinase